MKRRAALVATCACVAALRATAAAEWSPPDLQPAQASMGDVLAAYAKAAGTPEARFAQRRERWTYANGTRRATVRVAVKDDDFRATVALGPALYAGGRAHGVRWRADANGVAHATLSDDQGDAADRLPQSVFPFAAAECALAGESLRFGAPAWVVVDRPARDKPHWFYVDKSSGLIAHEITREGARTIVTSFERFEPVAGAQRPRRWHVADGDRANDLVVDVDAIEPEPVGAPDVAIPRQRRVFEPMKALRDGVVPLPATFRGRTIIVRTDVDGHRADFVLDTGTASIMVERRAAERWGYEAWLEHATVPRITVGALGLTDVSTLAIPANLGGGLSGILGYDFFLGHVVHVDYARRRVEVLTPEATAPVFRDRATTVIDGAFDEGIPLVRGAFGAASGARFALDTGSPHLLVLSPFEQRYRTQLDALLAPGPRRRAAEEYEGFLEGSVRVAVRRAAAFALGGAPVGDVEAGIEEPNSRSDAIDVPLDGIVGTDVMAHFEWWFDYDGGRIALRRNTVR